MFCLGDISRSPASPRIVAKPVIRTILIIQNGVSPGRQLVHVIKNTHNIWQYSRHIDGVSTHLTILFYLITNEE